MIYNYQIAIKNNELILDRFIFNNHIIQTLTFNDFLELAKEVRNDVYNKHCIKDNYYVNFFGSKKMVISMMDIKEDSYLKKLNRVREVIDKIADNHNCYTVIDVSIKGWKSFMSIEQFLKRTYYINILEKFKSENDINLFLNSKFSQSKNPKLFSCHDIINCILDNWYYLLDNGKMYRVIYLRLLILKYFRFI